MSKKNKTIIYENITLGKMVHGGQALAEAPNGKKLFVWGGLPGEVVDVRVTKKKSSYLEGIAEAIHTQSPNRIEPIEPLSYLSTSPWQIMDVDYENDCKQVILAETFSREGLDIKWGPFTASSASVNYRNKMEFGFWGNDDGLHLAHYVRGSHGKQMIQGSVLSAGTINEAARSIRDELGRVGAWGGKLKTVVVRTSAAGEVVAALFIKEDMDELPNFKLPEGLKGIDIYLSDPRSPASVATKKLYSLGDITLSDTIMGVNITYDVMSFFQVNLPIFELALGRIDYFSGGYPKIDMYSGVGTIGVPIGGTKALIETDAANIAMAKKNVGSRDIEVVHASSEDVLSKIESGCSIIVDPPRAGLHKKVVDALIDKCPPQIVYLSCNPSTQARDVALLSEKYKVRAAEGYNFFPRTPHIESLIIMERK